MVVNVSSVKTKLDTVLTRDDLKSAIEISSYSMTRNDFGELERVFSSQTVAYGIPVQYQYYQNRYDKLGEFSNASFIVFLPADTVITKNDIINFQSTDFKVLGIQKPFLNETVLLLRVFVGENLEQMP